MDVVLTPSFPHGTPLWRRSKCLTHDGEAGWRWPCRAGASWSANKAPAAQFSVPGALRLVPPPGRAWDVSSSPKHSISQRVLRAPGRVFPRHWGKLWTMRAWPQPYDAEVALAGRPRHAEAPGPRMRGASTSRSAASSTKSANTVRCVSAAPRPPRRSPQQACPRGGCAVARASRALAGREPSVVICVSFPLHLTSHPSAVPRPRIAHTSCSCVPPPVVDACSPHADIPFTHTKSALSPLAGAERGQGRRPGTVQVAPAEDAAYTSRHHEGPSSWERGWRLWPSTSTVASPPCLLHRCRHSAFPRRAPCVLSWGSLVKHHKPSRVRIGDRSVPVCAIGA